MSYSTQAGRPTQARRRRRRVIVIGALLAFLAAALFTVYAYDRGWVGSKKTTTATATATCTPVPAGMQPSAVTVNVYNGTQRSGLARTTAAALRTQGFVIGEIGNDPYVKTITGVGEVRYGPAGAAQAKVVAARVPGVELVKKTASDQASDRVDLVLGPKFTKVATPKITKTVPKTC